MNAVSLKPDNNVAETLDKLIAHHGLGAVVIAVTARLPKGQAASPAWHRGTTASTLAVPIRHNYAGAA